MFRYLLLEKQENNFAWDLVGHRETLMWDFRTHLDSQMEDLV